MLIPFKLLVWFLAMRYGDSGSATRPWIFGVTMGLLFGSFDLLTDHLGWGERVSLFAAYLVAACLFTNLRYRLEGILPSLILAVVGTGVMFFGVPFLISWMFENGVE